MHQCQTCTGYLTLDAISYRCGRVWTLSRPAEWCWARPTQPTPNPAPSGETTASKLESKEQILSAVQSWTSTFLYCNGCMLYQYLPIQFYCLWWSKGFEVSLRTKSFSLTVQEHHPRQRLRGECQARDQPVVQGRRGVQLRQLCPELAVRLNPPAPLHHAGGRPVSFVFLTSYPWTTNGGSVKATSPPPQILSYCTVLGPLCRPEVCSIPASLFHSVFKHLSPSSIPCEGPFRIMTVSAVKMVISVFE